MVVAVGGALCLYGHLCHPQKQAKGPTVLKGALLPVLQPMRINCPIEYVMTLLIATVWAPVTRAPCATTLVYPCIIEK